MSAQGPPSIAPQSNADLGKALLEFFSKAMQNVDDCLPAEVISFDRKNNVAKVRPLVQVLSSAGEAVPRASVASVPVLAIGGGNFFMNFPLKPGDKGWLKANDRDISLFKQAQGEARPNTLRKHSFEDGIFIPDQLRNYSIDAEDENANLVIQHKDGKVRVAVWEDRVKTTCKNTSFTVRDDDSIEGIAPKIIRLETPILEVTGIIQAGTGIGAGGLSSFNGSIHTTGDQISDGGQYSGGDQVAGTVSQKHHIHEGVEPGGGTTAEPVK